MERDAESHHAIRPRRRRARRVWKRRRIHSIGYYNPATRTAGSIIVSKPIYGACSRDSESILIEIAHPRFGLLRRILAALQFIFVFSQTHRFRVEWIRFYVPGTRITQVSPVQIPAHTPHLHYAKSAIELRPANGETITI